MPQTLIDRTCRRCGRPFTVTLQRFNQQKRLFGENGSTFCSRACFNDPTKYEDRRCATCGETFRFLLVREGTPRNKGLYCSRACIPLVTVGKVTATCPLCQQPFSYYASTYTSAGKPLPKTCGWRCPGRPPVEERVKRIHRPAWKARRAEVIARDGGRCRRCDDAAAVLTVHHIVAWKLTHDDSLENLLTLCRPCHAIVEGFAEGSGQQDWEARCRAS